MPLEIRPPVLQEIPALLRLGVAGATHVLEKDGTMIGAAAWTEEGCTAFAIEQAWRRRGYGTFLMKALLRAAQQDFCLFVPQEDEAARAFCAKFGFEPDGDAGAFAQNTSDVPDGETAREDEAALAGAAAPVRYVRCPLPVISALSVAHAFLMQYGRRGGFAIDATAGNGQDTLFLARLVGESGHVLALDIQEQAVTATTTAVAHGGCGAWVRTVCDSHENLARYAAPGSVDIAVFNLGYLPGGDRTVFTTPDTSVPAIGTALRLLRRGGVLTACVYAGGLQGTHERDAVLSYFRGLPPAEYTVLITEFAGRSETQAIPVCVQKQ